MYKVVIHHLKCKNPIPPTLNIIYGEAIAIAMALARHNTPIPIPSTFNFFEDMYTVALPFFLTISMNAIDHAPR
eukprot:CAMPEP_0184653988 /NCGR_PEP_ID=MMETSP0308-20130426/11690_1 /TAXON_ID=38269 /ORGANISM="Gloeochaete witrockiana, Strain SAG 46.84" /LENGTH=73 /DNA_ID=CAMNT_0027089735 /DNA_START=702 /DNA_END=923 /DNA_ORIENTATION=+